MHRKAVMASAFAVAVLFMMTMAATSWGKVKKCDGAIGAVEIKAEISAGPGCDLSGATVRGNVNVRSGGNLRTKEGTATEITGNVEGTNAEYAVLLGRTSIGGRLRLIGTKAGINVGTPEGRTEGTGSVNGNVEIEGGISEATLYRETVGGNVQMLSNSAATPLGTPAEVEVVNSTVGGKVELGNNSLANEIGDTLGVRGTSVAGNLLIFNNTETRIGKSGLAFVGYVTLSANHVGGNAELLNNIDSGTGNEVSENVVTNTLNCAGNMPPPFGGANTAKQKLGQCELL